MDITNAITISAWVYLDTDVFDYLNIVEKHGTSVPSAYQLYRDKNNERISLRIGSTALTSNDSSAQIAAGEWTHVAVTYVPGGQGAYFYKNGKAAGSAAISEAIESNSQPLYIGRTNGTAEAWDGRIDDVRIYNRALTSSEVSKLYDWAPGPVGWWKLDENTGTSALDSSGNANTGTLTGGPKWTTGKLGQSLSFDGVNDDVNIGGVINPSTAVTVSAWAYSLAGATADNKEIFANRNDTISLRWSDSNATPGNVPTFFLIIGGSYRNARASTSLNTNTWNHIVGTYDGTTIRIYVDGILAGSTVSVGTIGATTLDSLIGVHSSLASNFFNGLIDDVRIYNYALTPKQITSVMNAGHPAVGSPVGSAIAHYKFDEGYGTIANNSGSNGSALNGTLSGTTPPSWRNKGKFGKSLNFSGSTAYLDIGNPAAAQITSDLTLSSWVYLSSNTANQDIIAKRGLSSQWGYRLWVDSTGTPKIDVSSSRNVMATASASQALAENQWYHLLGTYSASQSAITIYVDGLQKGQTTASVPISLQNSTANLNIGREASAVTPNYVNGSLDEVKLYNYSLSSDEVTLDYNQGKSIVLGSLSTDPDGITASNSAARAYCPPGDTATCNPPVAHWTLDERTGTSANDISGNNNTGTLTGGPQWTSGKVGQALQLDGVDDAVTVGSGLANPANATITAWVNYTDSPDSNGEVVTFNDNLAVRVDDPTSSYGVNGFFYNGSTWIVTSSGRFIANTGWHHLAYTFDDANNIQRLYIDGQVLGTSNSTDSISYSGSGIKIGAGGNSSHDFEGKLDDVRIYNYARTPTQVAWEYNQGKPVAHWKLDECTGTQAFDSSGNANNGTITPGGSGNTTAGTCNSGTSTEMWNDGTNGKFNSSLGFDGTDDYIEISDTANLRFDTSSMDFSLFTWTKRTTTGTEYILSKEDADNDGWRMQFNSSNQALCSEDATDVTSTSSITDTDWHLIGCTIDRDGNRQVYIDGVANGSTVSMGTDAMATTSNIRIGTRSYTSTSYFNGQIDDIRLYNYPLTPTQVRTVYNEGAAIRFGPLIGSP